LSLVHVLFILIN